MVIGNRAFWLALLCGLTLLVGGAVADAPEMLTPVVRTSEVNSQAANTAPTFSTSDGTITTSMYVFAEAYSTALQPDGKLIIAGGSYSWIALMARYLTDGSLDASFGSGGMVITPQGMLINSIALQADGKILAVGRSDLGKKVIRYNQDGSLDNSFGVGGFVYEGIDVGQSVSASSDGKIYVAGSQGTGDGNHDFAVARYNTDGSLDSSFGLGGIATTDMGADDFASTLVIQPDGKVFVAGTTRNSSLWYTGDFALVRYRVDGTLDISFSADGKLITDLGSRELAYSAAIQPDNKIVLSGFSGTTQDAGLVLARYNPDGGLDGSFGGTGIVKLMNEYKIWGRSLAIQPDLKIIVAGYTSNGRSDFALNRFNTDGTQDADFGPATSYFSGSSSYGMSVALRPDGKVIVGGYTGEYGGVRSFAIASHNHDGSPDATFGISNSSLNNNPTILENLYDVIAPGARVYDKELVDFGNYAGSTLTLVRQGGASPEDGFASSGYSLSHIAAGSYFAVDGITIGQVLTNSGGTLQLRFLGANATQARVNKAMQQIAYTNTSDRPPAQVLIDWTFDDGNTGAQGTGGALSTTGTVTVNITPVNDPPRLDNPPPTQTAAVGTAFSYTLPANTFSDPDGDSLTYSAAMADNTGIPPWLSFNAATRTFTGTPSQGDVRSLALKVTAKDPSNAEAVAYLALSVQNKPTLTASVTAANKPYDATPAATITACTLTGVINGDSVTCAAGSASFSSPNVGTSKTVTATGITLGGAQAVNYTLSSSTATTTANITQATQAALALQATSTTIFEGTSTTLSAQGGSTLGTITYSVQATNGLTCAISGNQLTSTGSAGTCTVTATRSGDGNYLPVSSTPLAITVTLPQRQLVVSKTGSGAVYSSPSGISCGSVCSAYYNKYTPVTLTAVPASGQYFVGWGGACSGLGSCTVNMSDNRSVTATFAVIPQNGFSLTVSKTGNGTISSLSPNASINCGINCQSNFAAGQLVTLFAQPDRGHTFMGWSGQAAGLCGRQTTCDVYMSSNQSISGDFKNTYLLILPAIQLLLE